MTGILINLAISADTEIENVTVTGIETPTEDETGRQTGATMRDEM